MCITLLQRNYMSESTEQNKHDPKKEQDQVDLTLTAEEEELLKQKLEELRKRDPFIYR